MKRACAAIGVACALGTGLAGTAAASAGGSDGHASSGRILVALAAPEVPAPLSAAAPTADPGATLELRDDRLERVRELIGRVVSRNDLEVERSIPEVGVIVVEADGADPEALSQSLTADPLVASAEPEPRMRLMLTPNDPAFSLHDSNAPANDFMQWWLRRYHGPGAWSLSKGGNARVAVIDTGAFVGHPDLAGNLAGKLDCTSSSDEAVGTKECTPGGDVSDSVGHGTHTAGLACADSGDGYGIASLGFRCNLDVVRTDLTYGSIVDAVVAATDRGADVISMSFGGGPPNSGLFDAFEYARNGGVILVAAGDNAPDPDAGLNYPAQWIQNEGSGPNINAGRGLVVTMAKRDGTRNINGQRNLGVSVAAFGSATDELSGGQQGILSTWPPALPIPPEDDALFVRTSVDGDNRYAYLVGTSMATPQVAGLAALIRSVRPSMPADKVARAIKLTADGNGDYGRGLGWGIIDAYPAVASALGRDITAPGSRVRWARVSGASAAARRPLLRLRIKRFDRDRLGMPTSGVRAVHVFVSVDGGSYKRFRKTRRKRVRFRGRAGREYSFYTRAVDRAGNREAAPGKPDVSLSLP